jgi:hypothetical protein
MGAFAAVFLPKFATNNRLAAPPSPYNLSKIRRYVEKPTFLGHLSKLI